MINHQAASRLLSHYRLNWFHLLICSLFGCYSFNSNANSCHYLYRSYFIKWLGYHWFTYM